MMIVTEVLWYSKEEVDDFTDKVMKKMRMDLLAARYNKKESPKVCKYCNTNPCVMDLHYDELMEMGREMETTHDNSQIRYHHVP
jgi:hypothetical protein